MRKIFILLSVLILTSCVSNQAKVQESYDKELLSHGIQTPFLLKDARYQELIDLYTKLGDEYLGDVSKENFLFLEIDSIDQSKSDLGNRLNEFVSSNPKSYIPYYLRSAYLSGVAWSKRGDKFISETSQSQVDGFTYYKELAKKDIDKAISINGSLSWLYIQKRLILVGQRGNEDEKNSAFDKALQLRPESYMLWNDLLHSNTARWGGSLDKMSKIIDSSKEYWQLNPRLEGLRATIPKELGDQARFANDYVKAESLYKESLTLGDHPWTRFELGNIQMNRGDFTNGCRNIFLALDMRPTLWLINRNVQICNSKGYGRGRL